MTTQLHTTEQVQKMIAERGTDKYDQLMKLHGELMKCIPTNLLDSRDLAYVSMITHKLARFAYRHGSTTDTLLDIIGYTVIHKDMLEDK